MQQELHLTAEVLPGGRIEVASPDLTAGQVVNITIAPAEDPQRSAKRSIVDILAEAPGHLMFKSVQEVDDYIREERAAWDR